MIMKNNKMSFKNSIETNYRGIVKEVEENNLSKKNIFVEAVTKTRTVEEIRKVINAGAIIIAENKVQEAEKKIEFIKSNKNIKIHLIGHLQSNKSKKAVSMFDTIESVDSLRLLKHINKASKDYNKEQEIYLQVNIGKDHNKYGFDYDESLNVIKLIQDYKYIKLTGLMTILPNFINTETTKKLYTKMKDLHKEAQLINNEVVNLSMGMSNDYLEAVRCGASHVRIGTAIFGKRL